MVAKKILFLNTTGSTNKGDIAAIIGHITGIKQFLPEAEITIWSGNVGIDKMYEAYGVKVQAHPWYTYLRWKFTRPPTKWAKEWFEKTHIPRTLTPLVNLLISCPFIIKALISGLFYPKSRERSKHKHRLEDYDIVLDTLPDRLNEPSCGFLECLGTLFITFMAQKLIRRPIILGPSSIGPLNSALLKFFAKAVLNDVAVIATRDKISLLHLGQLGVSKPKILAVSDMAFLLPSASEQKVDAMMQELGLEKGKDRLIGIVPRMFVWKQAEQYFELLARFCDWLAEEFGATICLVPHELGRGVTYWSDETISNEVVKRVRRKEAIRILSGKYEPPEIKGLVANFDIMVSWRLHGAIIAISNSVPTIALSYGDKFNDLFINQLHLPEMLIDIRDIGPENLLPLLKQTFKFTWQNRKSIATKLAVRVAELRELALSYSKLVSEMASVPVIRREL